MDWIRALRVRAHSSPLLVDAVLAVVAWLACLMLLGARDGSFVLISLQVLPLAFRRVQPFVAALVIAAGCALQVVTFDYPLISNLAALAIIYATTAYGSERWQARAVGLLGLAGALIGALRWVFVPTGGLSDYPSLVVSFLPTVMFMWMSVAAAWMLGDVVRRRRAVVARLREQNEALARDQAQRMALAAQGERAAIAREMHDIVAHSLSVVVVQADGGAYAARTALARGTGGDVLALENAAQTLETLAATAREALTDTRALVGVLRDNMGAAEFEPTQGLANLDALVQRVRETGVPVEAAVRGDLAGLPRELDLAAYRVVQESLTNVLKHAGSEASVTVDVLRTPAVLHVRVSDDGRGPGVRDGHGNGIVGMRERMEVLGGTLHAGPRTGGGFEVTASAPIPSTQTTPEHQPTQGARNE